MKLSKREAILLILLIIVALCYIEYQLVFVPGMTRYEQLSANDTKVQAQVDGINRLITSIPSIKAKKESILSQISIVDEPFFDQLNTDALLWSTFDLLSKSGLVMKSCTTSELNLSSIDIEQSKLVDLTYQLRTLANDYANAASNNKVPSPTPTPAAKTTAQDIKNKTGEVEVYSVNIDFFGSYDQMKKFISSVESLKKMITITTLGIDSSDIAGSVNAQILINFYGAKKIVTKPDSVNIWSKPVYSSGQGSPFSQGITAPSPTPKPALPTTR